MQLHKSSLLFCLGLWFAALLPCTGAPSWDIDAQGHLITALCPGPNGTVWIGTEESGIWRYDPAAPASKQYTHYTQQDGLGDNNAYALAVDKAGRLWAGTLNHGVSVFNGKTWRTYGPLDGPLGSRIFALAVNPKDGGVWGATEAGLFRYVNSHWTYFTRADGLPSDQANALAFDQGGTLYVGTQCDGIAIASPADGYKSWRIVPGPITLPNAPSGTGLPSALINCLLVTKSGTVYAGTTCGLASSQDKGRTWHYRRGLDWKAKEEGRYPPVTPASVTVSGNLLSEDYVTALAERADGSLFVGHRQTSVEAFSPKTWLRVQSGLNGATTDSDISSLLVTGQTAWAGLYGGGLLPPGAAPAETTSASSPPAAPLPVPPLPVPAKPPTLAELKTMLSRANALSGEMPIGSGVYLGEDWQTQGDWVGRYGRQYAMLWAVNAPDNDEFATANVMSELYQVTGQSGPHHDAGDGIKHWVQWLRTENPHTLYNPELGYRRQAEVDDHSEAYPMTQDGPDLWFTVKVPSGVQRISFYIFNKDGYFGGNRYRDYLIKLRPFTAKKVEDMEERRGLSPPSRTRPLPDLEAATIKAPIAQARISNFRGGVYKQFLVWGPCLYLVQVSKSYSFNTICSGTFMDALTGAQLASNSAPMDMMGGIHYAPPEYDFLPKDQSLSIAASLWDALNDAYNENAATIQRRFRVESYRLALNKKADNSLLTNWRWGLTLWEDNDKIEYQKTIQKAQSSLNILNQELAAHTRISQ